jgi:hypothetical protein
MKNYARQNLIVRFAKLDSPVFLDRKELNTKELDLQALINISPLYHEAQKSLGEVF